MGGDPPQGGTPATVGPRWPGHRQARPPLWAACRPARGLPWPCRPGNRPAFPPAGGVPRAPPRANARGGGACAASARGGLNCRPPQRREERGRARLVSAPERRPQAPERPRGGLAQGAKPRSASPEGRLRRAASAQAEPSGTACAAGVAVLARLAGAPPTGPEGRTAPQPPHCGGRAAPEHLRRNRARAVTGARPAQRPACGLGLAAGTGGPRYGWRLASAAGAQT